MLHDLIIDLIVILFLIVQTHSLSPIQVFTSNNDGLRVTKLENILWSDSIDVAKSIRITDEKFQRYDGIGGSFMRSGAKVLNSMPSHVQESILHDLFDPSEGAGFLSNHIIFTWESSQVPFIKTSLKKSYYISNHRFFTWESSYWSH